MTTALVFVTARIFGCFPTTFKGFLRVGNVRSQRQTFKDERESIDTRLELSYHLKIFFTVRLLCHSGTQINGKTTVWITAKMHFSPRNSVEHWRICVYMFGI